MRNLILSALLSASLLTAASVPQRALPTVNLGYATIQATANAPVDNLRFAAPLPPSGVESEINDGQNGRVCPQAVPGWIPTQTQFITDFIVGLNTTGFNQTSPPFTVADVPAVDPRTSEDCLFLDVLVPQGTFDQHPAGGAPVVVWIHGGGFTYGEKDDSLAAGGTTGSFEFLSVHALDTIFVTLNYRLGLFGWLAGSSDVTSNAGLLDQRLALQWVQDHIHSFGGDAKKVTVVGESAGATSILHHITAGPQPAPFSRAIIQSPAFSKTYPVTASTIYNDVLSIAASVAGTKVSTVSDLRALSYEDLLITNWLVVSNSIYGTFTFGPVVDDCYVPDFPLLRLQSGHFDQSVGVLVGHNSNEGFLFTPPAAQLQDDASLATMLQAIFPIASPADIAKIEALYPASYDGTETYTTPYTRAEQIIADFTVNCNAQSLADVFAHTSARHAAPSSFAYTFGVGFGIHGEDIPYTFFASDSGADYNLPINATIAAGFQEALMSFALTGQPHVTTGAAFNFTAYGSSGSMTVITDAGFATIADPDLGARCAFWAATSTA